MTDKVTDDCYIVMNDCGIQRMTKRPGKLARGEISVRVRLSVPESCFEEPAIMADIDVPEEAVRRPVVEVEVPAVVEDAE